MNFGHYRTTCEPFDERAVTRFQPIMAQLISEQSSQHSWAPVDGEDCDKIN